MSQTTPRKVAVSYAWKTEAGGASAGQVEAFCQFLAARDVAVLRDVQGMKLGDSLSGFMREIGTSRFLCVFLSEPYLRSPNCMYELLVAWETGRHQPEVLRKQMKVWVMPDARDTYKPEGRIKWTEFWKGERDRMAPRIRDHAADGLDPAELEAFKRVARFADAVDGILCFIADTLSPTSIDELQNWAAAEFPAPTAEDEARMAEEVYLKTVDAVDEVLLAYPKITEFIAKARPALLNGKKLADATRRRQLDGKDCFKAIEKALHSFAGSPVELDKLRGVVGGLATLTVNRQWVLAQRRKRLQAGLVAYPGTRGELLLHDERQVHFLHLLAASLADGLAELARIFGEPDRRLVPDPPAVLRGLGPDAMREHKLNLIRAILRPDRIDEANEAEVNATFEDAKEAMQVAWEKGEPFYGQTIGHRESSGLRLEYFLLLVPSGSSSLRDIVADPIHVFDSLHNIFTTIQRRLLNL